jgi:hypothetical protein
LRRSRPLKWAAARLKRGPLEEALTEDGPSRLDALLDLELWHHSHAPTGDHLVANKQSVP